MKIQKNTVKLIIAAVLIVGLSIAAFFWNEARKEIVFLCGNFKKGVSEGSVIRQLNTGAFLRYNTQKRSSGKYITADSPVNLFMYKCIIEIDENGVVTESYLE